jgi:hypothetical protein
MGNFTVKSFSLHDFFWVGGESNPLPPSLVNGLLVSGRKNCGITTMLRLSEL